MAQPTFQTCKVRIRMMERGTENLLNTIEKEKVTPPEYMAIENVHGRSNVELLEVQKDPAQEQIGFDRKGRAQYRERSHSEEWDRLCQQYGQGIMAEVAPGKEPRLPYTFDAAGISTHRNDDNVTDLASAKDPEIEAAKVAAALTNKGQGGK